jgi:virulence factor Mce-like protein
MFSLPKPVSRALSIGLVAVVVLGLGYYLLAGGGGSKKLTAYFSSGVGVYPGTAVDVLGITVGSVTKVTPDGDSVKIEMKYNSKYSLPSNAVAVMVANSLVSDRYIQLAPAYSGTGPTLANGASLPLAKTASPAELDDIFAALNKLSIALGPNGANKGGPDKGALSALVDVTAANLQGNGAAFGQSITNLSKAAQTLANSRGDLFNTVKNLQSFSAALVASDKPVRDFENQLAQLSSDLAAERTDLGAALHNLTVALQQVSGFVKDNANGLHTDLDGLKNITGVLAKDKASLNETLAVAPVALANLVHAYEESTGTLGARANLDSLADPAQVCGALKSLNLLTGNALGSLSSQIISTCNSVASQLPGGLPSITGLTGSLLNGLPPIPGA